MQSENWVEEESFTIPRRIDDGDLVEDLRSHSGVSSDVGFDNNVQQSDSDTTTPEQPVHASPLGLNSGDLPNMRSLIDGGHVIGAASGTLGTATAILEDPNQVHATTSSSSRGTPSVPRYLYPANQI
jgi:hypothetical protein